MGGRGCAVYATGLLLVTFNALNKDGKIRINVRVLSSLLQWLHKLNRLVLVTKLGLWKQKYGVDFKEDFKVTVNKKRSLAFAKNGKLWSSFTTKPWDIRFWSENIFCEQ